MLPQRGRPWLVLVLGAFAAAAVACSAAESSKSPLPVCDANDPDCPGVPASSSPKKPRAESEPVPTDPVPATPAPATDAGTTTADAAADAAPTLGQFCTNLSDCCDELAAQGYDTTSCKSVLSTYNEDACYAKHASYKQYGDCS